MSDAADDIAVPDWVKRLETKFLVEWGGMNNDEARRLFRELRETYVALHDLREDRDLSDTAYVVVEEYWDGSHFEQSTIWAGPDKKASLDAARLRLAGHLQQRTHLRCTIQTWEGGKIVATRWLLCPGCHHCPTCDGRGMVRLGPNYTGECTTCKGLGVTEKDTPQ